jgi:hypothetical protein
MENVSKNIKIILLIFTVVLTTSYLSAQSLSISPDPAYFGRIPIGSSATRDVSIYNVSASAINITNLSVSGVSSSKFNISNNPGSVTLGPLEKLNLSIVFQPTTATGMDVGILEIQTSSGNYTDSLKAYGTVTISNVPTFERIFGTSEDDSGSKVHQTNDDGYIIVGSTTKPDENYPDAYIIKTDGNGKPVWTKIYGGNYSDGASDILPLTDGSFLMVGHSDSYGTGTNDIFVMKLSSTGDSLWLKSFTTTYDESASRIIKANDTGYIIVGSTKNTSDNSTNALVMKIDDNGNSIWKKDFDNNGGGEGAADIVSTTDGGYVFAGSSSNPTDGKSDVYLVKIDGSGNLSWQKTLGGSETDVGTSLDKTGDGGYIISGYTASYGNGGRDAYLVKTDGSGNEQWHKTFGTIHSDEFSNVITTTDGYLCVGFINSYFSQQFIYNDLLIIKTDLQGNQTWQRTFGGSLEDNASYVISNSSGGFVILGRTSSYDPKQSIYFIEINSDGNITKVENTNLNNAPLTYKLFQNFPNPFNPGTQIIYSLKNESSVTLTVYDILGRKVTTLVNNIQNAGQHIVSFNATNLASGIYIYQLQAESPGSGDKFISTRKMILLK